MLLGFQKRFAEPVITGIKRQTIRAKGKRTVPTVGSLAYCYTGLRTPQVHALGVWRICRVDEIKMHIDCNGVDDLSVCGKRLGHAELDRLAVADGFENFLEMDYWFETHHVRGLFDGWVIGWEWTLAGAATARGVAQ